MRSRMGIWSAFATVSLVGACNAVLGLEELERRPGGGDDGEAGEGSGGTAGSGKGGSSGSGTSKGGTSGRGGSGGSSGEAGGGDGSCEPGDETTCGAAFPGLLGNCRDGRVVCDANGTWGECSVTPEDADSCDTEGDDADCDGTPNERCPCVDGAMRNCGPATDDGICEFGTQTCDGGTWGDCEGAVLPEERDCSSEADNDCDGSPDNERDAVCPCAAAGTHVCVEDAPDGWDGPVALATAGAMAASPSCAGTGYERQVLSKFGEIDDGEATCGCTCGPPSNPQCSGSINMHRAAPAVNCAMIGIQVGDPYEYTNLVPGTCTTVTADQKYAPVGPTFSAGACTAQPTSTLTDAHFLRRMTACETNAGSPAGCDAGASCLPELVNPLQDFCIYQDGEHSCPVGSPYTEQTIYYDAIDDSRTCSACTCGSATGQCQGSIHFTRTGSCPGTTLVTTIPYGGCGTIPSMGISTQATPTTPMPMGMCPPMGGTVQGSVSTAGAVTLCCKP